MERKEQRNAEIFKLRNQGYTLNQIGEKYNISGSRVRQICKRQERRERMLLECDELANLPLPVYRALYRNNIKSKDFLIECLNDKNGLGIDRIGAKGLEELEKFVGFKIDAKKKVISSHPYGIWRAIWVLKRSE